MNTYKKLMLVLGLLVLVPAYGALPCGNSSPTTLNVGLRPGANLPYLNITAGGIAQGFDPLLITEIAKLLGYTTVRFFTYNSSTGAQTALAAGTIDVFADSTQPINSAIGGYNGVITDMSQVFSTPSANGYFFEGACCALALQFDQAITELVQNGTYANILQQVRAAGHTNGKVLGSPSNFTGASGILLEPSPYFSSEFGTIIENCVGYGPTASINIELPPLSPLAAYLNSIFIPVITGVATSISG